MTRDDADFAAYLAARWPSLVRALTMLGCDAATAEDVALSGLAGCYASWDRVRHADDVDAHVYGAVLQSWHAHQRHQRHQRRQRRRTATGPIDARPSPPPSQPPSQPPPEEPTEAELVRHALDDALRTLPAEEREVLVLRFAAELAPAQVAAALDVPAETVRSRTASALGGIDLAAIRAAGDGR